VVEYFEVLKKEEMRDGVRIATSRIITSCKKSNPKFEDPPPVNLPSLDTIFKILAAFPKGRFTTLDFRHWFYQISLPGAVKHLFTVIPRGKEQERFHICKKNPPVSARRRRLARDKNNRGG